MFIDRLGRLIAGLAIFIGLPLLAWVTFSEANASQGYFLQHPARVMYLVLVFELLLASAVWFDHPLKNREKQTEKPVQPASLVLIQIVSIAIVLLAPITDCLGKFTLAAPDDMRYVGLLLFTGGFCLMLAAQSKLGKHFSVQLELKKGHRLVTEGPYRKVRHPRYTGIIIFNIGLSLIFMSGAALVGTALLTGILCWRISAEEKMLAGEFDTSWQHYRATSWRLVPYLY